jgi:hypothetical protein
MGANAEDRMKARIRKAFRIIVFSSVLLPLILLSQQVIENPEKPLAKNAGRVLKLQEVWRINDDSGEFYFKYPSQLQIAADGSIFLSDTEQFLRFSADGKYLKNLYKKGEGPGEISRDFDFFVVGNELVIRDFNKERIWRTDYDGKFLGEFDIRGKRYNSFIGVRKDDFIFSKSEYPPLSERTSKLIELPLTVLLTSKNGKTEKPVVTFHPRMFMAPNAMRSWDQSIELLSGDGKYVIGYHGLQYLIEIVDIDHGRIIRSFNRKYTRIKYIEKDWEKDFNNKYGVSAMDYDSDIKDLKLNGDWIWVWTSSNDPNKGDLWDVFNLDGAYLDNFYLGAGKSLLKANGDEIYVTEKREDESIVLIKYKIIG